MDGEEKKALLVILDGWGLGPDPQRSALARAHTPVFDRLWRTYPHGRLKTYGKYVGLPEGQMGNSEVGHLNIGAGRVVFQELARINQEIQSGTFACAPAIQDIVRRVRGTGKRIHLLGLYSDGGVHAHIDHFKALIDIFDEATDVQIFIHAFLDGRDTAPRSGAGYIRDLKTFVQGKKAQIATIIGRYYAMDRDQRWERTREAYDLMVRGVGEVWDDFVEGIETSYAHGVTDEFVKGMRRKEAVVIEPGDEVVFVNFRTDRPRQLVRVLVESPVEAYGLEPLNIEMTTMTRYDETFQHCHVVFDQHNVVNTLGAYLSALGKTQLRAAETEKYAHVTYFFSGGEEKAFSGESRILVPSPKVATYDLQPEMSADPLTDQVCRFIVENAPDFVCINYANTDMVGHTGVFDAAMKAATTVDKCMGALIGVARDRGYQVVIIADHGNSDYMINDDGSPHTAHTMNPVPFIVISDEKITSVADGKLADIAPTLLTLMGIPIHPDMTGDVLIR